MEFSPAGPISVGAFVLTVVGVLVAIVVGVRSAALAMGESARTWTLRVAVVLMVWVASTSGVVLSGALSGNPFPAFPMFFAAILVCAVAFGLSPFGRLLARGLPLAVLVGFHGFRLPLELVLHSWSEQGTIPETMTWTGQNWDIATGVLAITIVALGRDSRAAAARFNLIGFALLLNVLRVAVMSSPLPFAWSVEPGLQLIAHMPYALTGSVLVASALAGHVILFRALRN